MDIAKQIQNARKNANLSQAEAAKAWGVPKRSIQNWEQKVSTPRGLALQKLLEIISLPSTAPKKPGGKKRGA